MQEEVDLLKKHTIELFMACLLLICFYYLSRQAAAVSATFSEQTVQEEKPLIGIDPGHGGDDPGMIGVEGLEEKGINLEISLLLKESLENAGYQVVMTRETDRGLYDSSSSSKKAQDMQRRIAFLEEKSPLLTVSIHQNSYQDPSVRGPQVFYYESSLKGKTLAEKIQESLNTGLEVARPRVVKGNTSYYLLKRSKGVLVIAECGFLTNPEEAELLKKKEYQKKVAEAVTEGIRKYIEESAAGSVSDKEI